MLALLPEARRKTFPTTRAVKRLDVLLDVDRRVRLRFDEPDGAFHPGGIAEINREVTREGGALDGSLHTDILAVEVRDGRCRKSAARGCEAEVAVVCPSRFEIAEFLNLAGEQGSVRVDDVVAVDVHLAHQHEIIARYSSHKVARVVNLNTNLEVRLVDEARNRVLRFQKSRGCGVQFEQARLGSVVRSVVHCHLGRGDAVIDQGMLKCANTRQCQQCAFF